MLFFSVKIDADPKPKTEPPIGGDSFETQHATLSYEYE